FRGVSSQLGGRDGGPHFLPSTDEGGGKRRGFFISNAEGSTIVPPVTAGAAKKGYIFRRELVCLEGRANTMTIYHVYALVAVFVVLFSGIMLTRYMDRRS